MARILVIEDDELLRNLVARLLAMHGHEATEASDGREGLQLFQKDPVDVVITDMIMPNQEGVSTIMELRKSHPKVGIIAMSGGALNSGVYLNLAGKLGAMRTLAKPFNSEALISAVNEVLAACQAADDGPKAP